jgi:hypothetical protein
LRALATNAMRLPALAAALALAFPAAALDVSYQYSLSTTTGVIPFAGVRLGVDAQHDEIFVIGDGQVRIFNQGGMEVFAFGDDGEMGVPAGVVALDDGDLMVLAYSAGTPSLVRCDFRGEALAKVQMKGVPAGFAAGFLPGAIATTGTRLFLADKGAMKVLVLEADGTYVASFDVAKVLDVADKRGDYGIRGFNVDKDGNVLFTVQPLFKAYVLSPAGVLRGFGDRGSAPGKFNVVGGIARDDQGYLYVTDILKSAVLVFDPDLRFVKEFGYRGSRPSNLAAPVDVVTAGGRIYVAQNARRGVSVFKVSTEPN